MTQDQMKSEVMRLLSQWQRNYVVSPLDQFAIFQMQTDMLKLLLKVRKENVECQNKN